MIRFVENVVVDDCHKGTKDQTAFKAGQVCSDDEMPMASQLHWMNRGKAEPVTESMVGRTAKKPAKAKKAAKKPAKSAKASKAPEPAPVESGPVGFMGTTPAA